MSLIAVPEATYDYVVLPTVAWCAAVSTGWLVAGEWICSNLLMKQGTMGLWDETKEVLTNQLGGLGWMATLGYKNLNLKTSQTNRCMLGTGFIIFGSALLARHWKHITVLSKVAAFGHIASGLFLCGTKPKVGGQSTGRAPPPISGNANFAEAIKK